MLASVSSQIMVYAQPFPVKHLRFQLTQSAVMFGDGMSGTSTRIGITRSAPADVPPQPSRGRAPPEWLRRWRTLFRPVLVFVQEYLVAAASLVWMCSRRRHPLMDELARQTLRDQRQLDQAVGHAPQPDPSEIAMQLLSSPLHRTLWPSTWQNEIETCPHDLTKRYGAPTACTDKSVRLYAGFLKCEQCGARWWRLKDSDAWQKAAPFPKPGALAPPLPPLPPPGAPRAAAAAPKRQHRPPRQDSPDDYQFDDAIRVQLSPRGRGSSSREEQNLRNQLAAAQVQLAAQATVQGSLEQEATQWRAQQQAEMQQAAATWQQQMQQQMHEQMAAYMQQMQQQPQLQPQPQQWQPPNREHQLPTLSSLATEASLTVPTSSKVDEFDFEDDRFIQSDPMGR